MNELYTEVGSTLMVSVAIQDYTYADGDSVTFGVKKDRTGNKLMSKNLEYNAAAKTWNGSIAGTVTRLWDPDSRYWYDVTLRRSGEIYRVIPLSPLYVMAATEVT